MTAPALPASWPALARAGLVCLLLGGLAGCSWLRPWPWLSQEATLQELDRDKLRELTAWTLEGRIAVRAREDGWSAGLLWRHQPGEDYMALSGPLGQQAASIRYGTNFITFEAADGSRSESAQPEALLAERLGFFVPLQALPYWVLALPSPEQGPAIPADKPEAAADFEQSGWRMHYDGFMREGDWVVPHKLAIRGNGMVLKLVVDRWRFDE